MTSPDLHSLLDREAREHRLAVLERYLRRICSVNDRLLAEWKVEHRAALLQALIEVHHDEA